MILVTGATGLVGSYLLHKLLLKGERVRGTLYNRQSIERTRAIFNSLGSNAEELLGKIEWIEGDVLDVMMLEEAMKGVDHVYHCAAVVSFDPRDLDHMMRINIDGTANVVNAALAAGVKKFCHVSSIASLGRTDDSDIIDEESEWRSGSKNSKYSRSKFMGEREVWRASAEGLPVVIVNPSIILGYGHPDKGSTRMFKTIHKNSAFYGKGTNGFVDVRDVVNAMVSLMESDIVNERFVVSAGNFTYKDIFSMIARGFKKPEPRFEVPNFILDIVWRVEAARARLMNDKPLITKETATTSKFHHYYSSSKLEKALNYSFIPIEDTIQSLCNAMKDELNGKKISA